MWYIEVSFQKVIQIEINFYYFNQNFSSTKIITILIFSPIKNDKIKNNIILN